MRIDPERVREAREAAGLSQEDLGRRSGLATRTILRLENGQTPTPRLETVEAIAEATGRDVDFFLRGGMSNSEFRRRYVRAVNRALYKSMRWAA